LPISHREALEGGTGRGKGEGKGKREGERPPFKGREGEGREKGRGNLLIHNLCCFIPVQSICVRNTQNIHLFVCDH